jgi:hypothetical protein
MALFFSFMDPLASIEDYQLAFWSIVAIITLFVIINPIYLIILSKHYMIKHGVNLIIIAFVMINSGIGSILILNKDRWNSGHGLDFANEIAFSYELFISSIILILGTVILACLKYKSKT